MPDPPAPKSPGGARRALKLAGLAGLAAALGVVFWQLDVARWLDPEQLRETLDATGPFAPLVLIAAMALAVVVSPIPSLPLDVAAGVVFGPMLGTLYAVTGALLGSVVSFLLARALGRDWIQPFLRGHVAFCSACSSRMLFWMVLGARLIPAVSFDVVSYGAGLTRMSLASFALATGVGTLPLTYLYVAFGSAVLENRALTLLLGVALVALFFVLPRLLERYDPFGLASRLHQSAHPD